jgi:HEAT repeat protein/cyclophilin family peptidyl-prolyl cis-trans isomerase
MMTAESRDTLRNLALWEDQRVTGNGKLFEYLDSPNPLVRLRTVEVIGRIQDRTDAGRLVPMLDDPDERVVNESLFALGQIGDDTVLTALVEFCAQAKTEQLRVGMEALGKIGGKPATDFLMEMLHNFHASVRGEAALALARAADPTTVPALLIAIHDPDPSVAWKAVYGLEKTPSKRVGESVLPLLGHTDPMVRLFAASTLGKQKYEDGVKALCNALSDTDPLVVISSAIALGAIGEDDAVHPLGKIVTEHPSIHARKAAAEAIGKIDSKKGKDYLIRALMDESAGVRIASITSLAGILGGGAEVFLTQMLSDGNRLVRASAIEGFGLAGIEEKIQYLMEIAGRDPDPLMRSAAVRGLAHFDDDRIGPFLVEMLSDEDWVVDTETVTAIGEVGYKPALGNMIELFGKHTRREDVNVDRAILSVIGEWKEIETVAFLREALNYPDTRIRAEAVEILEAMGEDPGEVKSDREFYEESFDRTRRRALSAPLGLRHAAIVTKHGIIEIELYGDDAIQTVANFINLAEDGFYNGSTFHRVAPNHVVQGGDPRGDGWGDAGYFIRSEFNQHRYGTGYVGVPHDGKDTGGSQLFITLTPRHYLDGRYTIFGRVTSGMEFVRMIDQGDTFEVRILD